MSESESPTRVEPALGKSHRAVAHGPPKAWESLEKNVSVAITIPKDTLVWLREKGYNLSRVFRDAAEGLMGEGELGRLEQQIDFHREQVKILEAARTTFAERKKAEATADDRKKAWLDEVAMLTEQFFKAPRDDPKFTRHVNLTWVRSRISRSEHLRDESADRILELILHSRKVDSKPEEAENA